VKKKKKKKKKKVAPVNDTQGSSEMTGAEVSEARCATRARAEELYEAWHSGGIPLPLVPVKVNMEQATKDAVVVEPEQLAHKSHISKSGWRDLRRATNYATKVLADGDAYEDEVMQDEAAELSVLYPRWRKRLEKEHARKQEDVDRHNARNYAAKAASDNEFIRIWDWYDRCMPIIESAHISMAIPTLAWPDDLKPMKDEDLTACVLSQSFGSLQTQFSPPARLKKLRGQHLDHIMRLITLRQNAPTQELADDTGQLSC
jgi:hypothetical protein